MAGLVRSRGRQFAGVDDERGNEFHKNLKRWSYAIIFISKRLIITVILVPFDLFECLHTCCSVTSVYMRVQAQYNNLFANTTTAPEFEITFLGFSYEFHKSFPFNAVQGLVRIYNIMINI